MSVKTRLSAVLPRGASVACDWFIERAENATIYAQDGREIIDFAGGIGVLNTGHCHPKIIKAVSSQLQQFTHSAFQLTPYQSYIELAEKLLSLVPIQGEKKCQFFSTGAEAVENAIKIARAATQRHGVIAFDGGFHGRTMMTLALTGKVRPYKKNFGVMPAGVYHAQFPSETQNVSVKQSLKSIARIFKTEIAPEDVAAMILEPVQGEGGFHIAPDAFMRELRKMCDDYGIVLIADEVQSGFARTGKWFAMSHYAVEADLMTMAKSLAGGIVLSGVVGKKAVMDAPEAGGLGGTYAGNPLGIAAALAVLEVIEEEGLLARSQTLGAQLMAFLQQLQAPEITEIRGIGSMVAIEFGDDTCPNSAFASAVRDIALEHGLLLLTCGAHGNVLRFLYPLTIPEAQFQQGLAILAQAIEKARQKCA